MKNSNFAFLNSGQGILSEFPKIVGDQSNSLTYSLPF